MLTVQGLLDWIHDDEVEQSRAFGAYEQGSVARFEVIVKGLLDCHGDTAFGVLSDAVRATKPKDAEGKDIKGGKADPVVAVRCSELRQIVGAVRAGMSFEAVRLGRNKAVEEARLFLKGFRTNEATGEKELKAEPMTAKGELQSHVEARKRNKAIGKAAGEIASSVLFTDALTEEQHNKLDAGMDLALVITDEQRKALVQAAAQSVEAEKIRKRLESWQKRADAFVADMLKDGIGEDDAYAILDRMFAKLDRVTKGEPALV